MNPLLILSCGQHQWVGPLGDVCPLCNRMWERVVDEVTA
jgi:hypothetical protein